MKHGSLFSGIGGFDLAAEWMGWENVFHCELTEFNRRILNYYWPNAKSYEDITKTDFTIWRGRIDILTGGFPCQPYSQAGKRLGKEDERHLWPEMLRAIREIKPRFIVGENVSGLLTWKMKGMKSKRFLFQLSAKVRHINENGFGLLPTPQKIDGSGKGRKMRLKTGNRDKEKLGNWRGDLKDWAFVGLLPTPTKRDWKGLQANEYKQLRGEETKFKMQSLPGIANKLMGSKNSQLNPLFVAEMMGFPPNWTILPFLSGGKNHSWPMVMQWYHK